MVAYKIKEDLEKNIYSAASHMLLFQKAENLSTYKVLSTYRVFCQHIGWFEDFRTVSSFIVKFLVILGATKVSGKDFLAIVTDRAEILRDGLEEGQDPSFWIIFQMMVRGALSKIDFSANARR